MRAEASRRVLIEMGINSPSKKKWLNCHYTLEDKSGAEIHGRGGESLVGNGWCPEKRIRMIFFPNLPIFSCPYPKRKK
jgi:hypothetical protein